MRKKLQSITGKLYSLTAIAVLLLLWQGLCVFGIVPDYMLPSPLEVIQAFVNDFPFLMSNAGTTLMEAFLGLLAGILIGFFVAVGMDHFDGVYQAVYPLVVLTQTVPTVAIAPLLILWLGPSMAPKIVLIIIVTFFPITVGLLDGFRSADGDMVNLLRSMGATKFQIFRMIKIPSSLSHFFASLRISASYSIVGAVISEWLGGYEGLGVYMTRVKKSFAFDKMFAVIFLISAISLLLIGGVNLLQKKCMPWEEKV
ncbi:MAG: ABC transporter permease [Lachnospiraceae bacterium]